MRNQFCILKIKWNDFISNSEVSCWSGLEDRETVQQRHRRFFGHVARLTPVVPASAALCIASTATDGVCPMDWEHGARGRPSKTWLKQICAGTDTTLADALGYWSSDVENSHTGHNTTAHWWWWWWWWCDHHRYYTYLLTVVRLVVGVFWSDSTCTAACCGPDEWQSPANHCDSFCSSSSAAIKNCRDAY